MPAPTLYERASKYVAKMTPAVSGAGGHDATFKVACVLLQGFDLARSEARAILDEYNGRCSPPWSERELEHKLNQADKMTGLETRDGMQQRGCLIGQGEREDGPRADRPASQAPSAGLPVEAPVKPEFAPEKLKAFAARWRQFVDTAWLADRSPISPFDLHGALPTDAFLRAVFREGEKVIVFTNQMSQGQALWPKQMAPIGGDQGVWYLAQPVDGREHVNPRAGLDEDGHEKFSRRSEESVTDWRHLVLESDEADARDWLGALVQLPLRICAIYTSGGRSIHALVRVDAPTKQEWDSVVKQLRPPLVTLGADPKAMSAMRLTRLPGCWRGMKLQKLLFLNPAPEFQALCTLPKLRDSLSPWIAGARQLMTETPAAIREWEQWETVEKCEAALRWFESAATARPVLAELTTWMEGA